MSEVQKAYDQAVETSGLKGTKAALDVESSWKWGDSSFGNESHEGDAAGPDKTDDRIARQRALDMAVHLCQASHVEMEHNMGEAPSAAAAMRLAILTHQFARQLQTIKAEWAEHGGFPPIPTSRDEWREYDVTADSRFCLLSQTDQEQVAQRLARIREWIINGIAFDLDEAARSITCLLGKANPLAVDLRT